jgi:hypothetical protein
MKLLVGTLYTIEEEFDDCCASIRRQTYGDYEHLIVRNLPKKAAHDMLYGTFMERAGEFSLLVKVDADMVIPNPLLFEKIVDAFRADTELDRLLIAVQDFFTDRLMIGMNVCRNTVRWNVTGDHLFTDMSHQPGTVRKTRKDFTQLAPAAVHCPKPGPYQSFHFGFHRAMKSVGSLDHWTVLYDVIAHFERNPDARLACAILGANAVFSGRFTAEQISYTDDTLRRHFDRTVGEMTDAEIVGRAARSKLVRLSRLPLDRRTICRYYNWKSRFRDAVRRAGHGVFGRRGAPAREPGGR